MTSVRAIRADKLRSYPDQSIYAEFAATTLGLRFTELDDGTGLIFEVSSPARSAAFAAGRGSFFPQNNATAATLANDKYFANVLMARAGIATLGGNYFFLNTRHSAHRPAGHSRNDAYNYFGTLGGIAFIKPLNGSRGDFAQVVDGYQNYFGYIKSVKEHHDAVIIQRVHLGREYRVFVLDDEIVYSVAKSSAMFVGDGTSTVRQWLACQYALLKWQGVSSAPLDILAGAPDVPVPEGEIFKLVGRTNYAAGGTMEFAEPDNAGATFDAARRAVKALGLRAGAVDLFTDLHDDPEPLRVIEVNANPSIRFLEDAGREDLILRIWRHTFTSLGLIDV